MLNHFFNPSPSEEPDLSVIGGYSITLLIIHNFYTDKQIFEMEKSKELKQLYTMLQRAVYLTVCLEIAVFLGNQMLCFQIEHLLLANKNQI